MIPHAVSCTHNTIPRHASVWPMIGVNRGTCVQYDRYRSTRLHFGADTRWAPWQLMQVAPDSQDWSNVLGGLSVSTSEPFLTFGWKLSWKNALLDSIICPRSDNCENTCHRLQRQARPEVVFEAYHEALPPPESRPSSYRETPKKRHRVSAGGKQGNRCLHTFGGARLLSIHVVLRNVWGHAGIAKQMVTSG